MSAHTPGDWFTHREGHSTVYIESRLRDGVVQEVAACGPTEDGPDQQEANARLIAAAPDLLAALNDILVGMEASGGWTGDDGLFAAGMRAYRKATGAEAKP